MSTQIEDPKKAVEEKESFAETAFRLSGKSETEAKKIGAIDRADDQVEAMFAERYRTTNSPAHKAVWDRDLPIDLFAAETARPSARAEQVMRDATEITRKHKKAGTIYDENRKVAESVLMELGDAGYWGMLVDEKYGGVGAPMTVFGPFLSRLATIDATVSGLASVHGCIGAVDPVVTFGNAEQKQRFLPLLASGKRLSAFALTEPCAGSDLTALRTTAELRGDSYYVNGEKLFITNVIPGRMICLVCLINNKPAVLVCDLPKEENDTFRIKKYGLWALKHTYNQGIVFKDFKVPKENLLDPGTRGDGLTIAYHGLNRGRVSLCAGAAGNMRMMLNDMLPWARFRKTYGEAIIRRELVERRCGRLAAMIVAADALTEWTAHLLDQGYRGEMECTIAKIYGSEAQKEAAIEYYMKTHGGRSFLHGHPFGDNIHEFLAPCIYEGEGEMLGMAFFKSLVKEHGKEFFEPVGKKLQQLGIKAPTSPVHYWKMRDAFIPYGKWMMRQRFQGKRPVSLPPAMPRELAEHCEVALDQLSKCPLEVSGIMTKHQLKLADRQCRMSELSQRIQDMITIVVTCMHAARKGDEVTTMAANVLCHDMRRKLSGKRPTDQYFRLATDLGKAVADGKFKQIAGLESGEILFSYPQEPAKR